MELDLSKTLGWIFDHYGAINTLLIVAIIYLMRQLSKEQKESLELKVAMLKLQEKSTAIQLAGVRALGKLQAGVDQLLQGGRRE